MTNNQLSRLLRAAAHSACGNPDSIPSAAMRPGFETRVIAHWRPRQESPALPLFRRALALACALAVVTFALSYQTLVSSTSPELAIANNALEANYTP